MKHEVDIQRKRLTKIAMKVKRLEKKKDE